MKIHRRPHLVGDINVTDAKDLETGDDILMFGGGYGFVGLDRPAHDFPELTALFDELERTLAFNFFSLHFHILFGLALSTLS
ncbi:hypothetical protein HDV57DRAFT_512285 [Trichoderma longibrachiatum]